LNSEKGTTLLQYYQCTERLSTLESEALSSLTDEMASEVQKVSSAESRNTMIQSELEALDQNAKIQQQEPKQKLKELENLQFSFQDEHFSVLRRHHLHLWLKDSANYISLVVVAIRSSFFTCTYCFAQSCKQMRIFRLQCLITKIIFC
jgi:hypothetical protein